MTIKKRKKLKKPRARWTVIPWQDSSNLQLGRRYSTPKPFLNNSHMCDSNLHITVRSAERASHRSTKIWWIWKIWKFGALIETACSALIQLYMDSDVLAKHSPTKSSWKLRSNRQLNLWSKSRGIQVSFLCQERQAMKSSHNSATLLKRKTALSWTSHVVSLPFSAVEKFAWLLNIWKVVSSPTASSSLQSVNVAVIIRKTKDINILLNCKAVTGQILSDLTGYTW